MSTIIKFELNELRKLASNKNSCIVEKKVTQNLALQPWCLGNLKESLKNLLDYKIGKFDKEFNGILLSYKNLSVLQNVGTIRNDNADIHFQVQADYFIFQPHVGAVLQGVVNKKTSTHLGILVHKVFNVVIPRPTEEPGDKWIGTNVYEGQEVMFRIVVLDLYGALPYIRGELDERSITQCSEEDTGVKRKPSITVNYINFEKTKPNSNNQKQIRDGVPHNSSKGNTTFKHTPKSANAVLNGKSNVKNAKYSDGDHNASIVSAEKTKSKKSKVQNVEVKKNEGKSNKKSRRDM